MLDSPLLIITVDVVDVAVEIREDSSLLNTILKNVAAGEMIDSETEVIGGATVEVSNNEKIWSLLDVALSNVLAIVVLVDLTVSAVSRLVYTTTVLLIGVNNGGNVTDGVGACSPLDSALVAK